jgi:hypothetical protein
MSISIDEAEMMGHGKMVYDYTQYGHDHHVNVITEESFKHLVTDTFETIVDVLKETYGPYGSSIMISESNETTATKDGYNIYNALGFSHQYKRMVYLAIKKIIERVNNNVGDGTTSCILLAEKIFKKLNTLIETSEDKRNVKAILDHIEENLFSSTEMNVDKEKNGPIKPLTEGSLYALLMVAANYDGELVDYLVDAFCPICQNENDPRTPILSMNNVIVDSENRYEASSTTYKVQTLPGDYRVRINMEETFALSIAEPTKMKVILYDHTFGESEWNNLIAAVGETNEERIMLIARTFSATFMNNVWVRYCAKRGLVKAAVPYYLVEVDSGYFQDEIHDLAAVLKTKAHTIHDLQIKKDELVEAELSVYNYNCLAFYGVESPEEYVDVLQIKYSNEKSYAKRTLLNDRIRALHMKAKDSIITVRAESTLEQKLLSDKLDDCIAIAKSALEYGVVPNMLWYGYQRIIRLNDGEDHELQLTYKILDAIAGSIKELADDIWYSKHNKPNDAEIVEWNTKRNSLYDKMIEGESSYDIINDEFTDMRTLPTSAQYDMEIIVASISIVKYILSARALIFDAHLMQQQGDNGHFEFNS